MSSSQNIDAFPGLDFDFLRYIDVLPENQQRIQSIYLPYFAGCSNALDLGCGDADFVELCVQAGIKVVGVDSDEKSFRAAQARNLPVVQQDVFSYLAGQPDASVDGIFCAHLVEHLPYPKVIELVEQSFRILQPGGLLLMLTPNVRSLYSHLEMFYLHFGHVSFYHPRLLAFFLDHTGYADIEIGENEQTASPLMPFVRQMAAASGEFTVGAVLPPERDFAQEAAQATPPPPEPVRPSLSYRREIPRQGKGVVAAASYQVKRWLSRWLVQPVVDAFARGLEDDLADPASSLSRSLDRYRAEIDDLRGRLQRLDHVSHIEQHQIYYLEQEAVRLRRDLQHTAASLQSLNRPFETYVIGRKPNSATDRQ